MEHYDSLSGDTSDERERVYYQTVRSFDLTVEAPSGAVGETSLPFGVEYRGADDNALRKVMLLSRRTVDCSVRCRTNCPEEDSRSVWTASGCSFEWSNARRSSPTQLFPSPSQ